MIDGHIGEESSIEGDALLGNAPGSTSTLIPGTGGAPDFASQSVDGPLVDNGQATDDAALTYVLGGQLDVGHSWYVGAAPDIGASEWIPITPPVTPPPPPPTQPGRVPNVVDRWWRRFEPYRVDDDGSLDALLTALSAPYALVQEAAASDTDGTSGWRWFLDPDYTPSWALQWYGELIGTAIPKGTSDRDARNALKRPAGWRRGTRGAMVDAIKKTLVDTSSKSVFLFENVGGDPLVFEVFTFSIETPDTAATEQALLSQKPAGMTYTYQAIAFNTWGSIATGYADWAAVKAAFPHWQDVRDA